MAQDLRPMVVVGSINMDLVSCVATAPQPGETVPGSSFQTHPGGKGANQAVAAARLGQRVQMIGMVGDDLFGEQMRGHLQREGIDVTAVGRWQGGTGVACITVDARGENSIVVTPGANAQVTRAYVEQHREYIRGASIVLAQLEIPLESVLHLARLCQEYAVPLMLDPAPARTLPQELFPLVRWWTPNETEAQFYAAHDTGRKLAQAFLARGCRGVLLKLGARGALLATAGEMHAIAAPQVRAVDTTAAGDCCNGAFAAGLAMGMCAKDAAEFACVAAAISVTRAGAQPSMPRLEEVLAEQRRRGPHAAPISS